MELAELLDAATGLLSVPSTADRPGGLERALGLVLGLIGPGFTVERFESAGKPSALAYPGPQRPAFGVILNAHLDVVPAPDEQFRPYRDGGRLYGRGTQDMKVSALVLAFAFRELAGRLPYPLGLQLVTDEEVGGEDGTRHQLQSGVTAEFAVVGEASGLRIVTECKGRVQARLHAVGRSAHGAYPWLGDNALLKLQRSLDNVLAAYPVPEQEAWRTTVNLARVETGNRTFNQVPADAEAWLDIRFPAGDPDLDGASPAEITAYLQSLCQPGVTTVVEAVNAPHHAGESRPEIARLRAAARGQGYSGDSLRKHGSADVRFFSEYGISCVSFGIGGDGQHGPAEYADISTIEPYHRALTQFLTGGSA